MVGFCAKPTLPDGPPWNASRATPIEERNLEKRYAQTVPVFGQLAESRRILQRFAQIERSNVPLRHGIPLAACYGGRHTLRLRFL